MTKLIIGLGAAIVLVLGYFMFYGGQIDYVATMTDDVAVLETELAEIDAQLKAGTLTPEAAVKAQAKIVARLDSLNEAVKGSNKLNLTASQKAELVAGLNRMKDVLARYKATLSAVDNAALDLPEDQRRKIRGGRSVTISDSLTEAIDIVEEHVEEVVENYESSDETVDDSTSTTDESDDTVDESNDPAEEDTTMEDETVESDPVDEVETESEVETSAEASAELDLTDSTTTEEETTN